MTINPMARKRAASLIDRTVRFAVSFGLWALAREKVRTVSSQKGTENKFKRSLLTDIRVSMVVAFILKQSDSYFSHLIKIKIFYWLFGLKWSFLSIQMNRMSRRLNFFYVRRSFVCFHISSADSRLSFDLSEVQRAWAHLSLEDHHRNTLIMMTNYA